VHRAWQILLLSLSIDLVIPAPLVPGFSLHMAVLVAVALSATVAPFLTQRRAHETLAGLRGVNQRSLTKGASKAGLGVAGIATFLVGSKLLFTANLQGVFFIGVLAAAGYLVYHTLITVSRQVQLDREQLLANPALQIKRWEQQLLILLILPIAAARAISMLGVLTEHATLMDRGIFTVTSFVLLLLLKPERELFNTLCAKCKQPVPVVLASMGGCWRCDATLRERTSRAR
jgi:hypothetical protein